MDLAFAFAVTTMKDGFVPPKIWNKTVLSLSCVSYFPRLSLSVDCTEFCWHSYYFIYFYTYLMFWESWEITWLFFLSFIAFYLNFGFIWAVSNAWVQWWTKLKFRVSAASLCLLWWFVGLLLQRGWFVTLAVKLDIVVP